MIKLVFILIAALFSCAYAQDDETLDKKIDEMIDKICEDQDVRGKTEKCVESFPQKLYQIIASCAGNPDMNGKEIVNFFCHLDDSALDKDFEQCIENKSEEEIKSHSLSELDMDKLEEGCMDFLEYGTAHGWNEIWEACLAARNEQEFGS